ncbi:MAG: carboxymuconolactone decarboxylase family protein [Sphingomonadales bacterium]|nr:carboxymuconolactone decarboxylase family protein [Sphingomonadales bacterium]
MTAIDLAALHEEARARAAACPEGTPLDPAAAALIALGVAASVTALDRDAIGRTIAGAFDAGASVAQVQEVLALVSGLGVHSLMASAGAVLDEAARRGLVVADAPLDAEREALWQRHVGSDPFWTGFAREVPGFLDSLLRLSPDIFTAFFDYCAVPWRSGTVRAATKELVAMACDACPSHRFRPGLRLHLANAIKLGVGRRAIGQALDIAAAAPEHSGCG